MATHYSPTAFLLVKFKNSIDEPISIHDAKQMFTAAGRGTMNVVDWFDDNTHGNVDMSGNVVFGWLQLQESVNDYTTKRMNGTYNRWEIINIGRAAAVAAGYDLSKFTIVVVVTNIEVDLFGGTGGVCCTAVSFGKPICEIQVAPSVLCQEMIHGLGVKNHARRHGSDEDYLDPYDVMSMFTNCYHAGHHPNNPNIPIGPGLNAAFMKRCGWLDTTRASPVGQATLRPLHRRDLAGPLYAKVGEYFVEYRPSRQWDTGFPSIVLVHYIANDTSYLVAEMHTGSKFSWGDPFNIFESHGFIQVDAIDDGALEASITTFYSPAKEISVVGPVMSISGDVYGDGGGLVILNGRIIRIPPRSPAFRLIEAAIDLARTDDLQITQRLKTDIKAEIYNRVNGEINEILNHTTGISSPFDHINIEKVRQIHQYLESPRKKRKKRNSVKSI